MTTIPTPTPVDDAARPAGADVPSEEHCRPDEGDTIHADDELVADAHDRTPPHGDAVLPHHD